MRRHPSWRRASVIWSALTLVAAVVPTSYFVLFVLGPAHSAVRSGAWENAIRAYVILAPLVLAPAAALLLRRRWYGYRVAVFASAVLLVGVVVLGGLFVGIYFLPAAAFALCAVGAEALTRRAG